MHSPSMALAPGTVFARDFRIVRPLAEGGMGAVYVVEQLSTGKERALKVMLPSIASDPRSRERFVQEARAGAAIRSDHVVEVVGAGIDEGTGSPWLAMELLHGQTLADAVERGTLSLANVRECFAQLGHALGAAHAVGLVHRDLKPENIFLSTPRRAGVAFTLKVLDFGIAKVLEAGITAQSTTSTVGSPMWMSPEQASAKPVSTATDVWALGLIAFWVLTRRPYWKSAGSEHGTITALLTEILVEPLEPASVRAARFGLHGVLPPAFDAWFAHCVDREPSLRFREGGAAANALIDAIDRATNQRGSEFENITGATHVASTPSSWNATPSPYASPGNTPSPFAAPSATPSPQWSSAPHAPMSPQPVRYAPAVAPPAAPVAPRWRRYLVAGAVGGVVSVAGGLLLAQWVLDRDDDARTNAPAVATTGTYQPAPGVPMYDAGALANVPPQTMPPSAPVQNVAPAPPIVNRAEPPTATGHAARANARSAGNTPSTANAIARDSGAPSTVAAHTPPADAAAQTAPSTSANTVTTSTPLGSVNVGGGSSSNNTAPQPNDDWRYNGGPDPATQQQAVQVAQGVINRCWLAAQQRVPNHPTERSYFTIAIGVVERAYETRVPGIQDRDLRLCIQADMLRAQFPHVQRPFTINFRGALTPD